jgi:hypothetical protein
MGRPFSEERMTVFLENVLRYRTDVEWLGPWMEQWSIDEWPIMIDAVCGRVDVFRLVQRISNR